MSILAKLSRLSALASWILSNTPGVARLTAAKQVMTFFFGKPLLTGELTRVTEVMAAPANLEPRGVLINLKLRNTCRSVLY